MAINYNITFIDEMIQGSGDELDLGSRNLIHIKEPANLNAKLVTNEPGPIDDVRKDNRTIIDFELDGGFLYIGDKEYHLYRTKTTDVVYLPDGQRDLLLKDFPNGYSHIGVYGPFYEQEFCGIYLDELITQKKVMFSKYLNEVDQNPYPADPPDTYEPEVPVDAYSPDITGCYPLPIGPESPLAQCYTYWEPIRPFNPLNPLSFDYDLFENKIHFRDETRSGYYIVEYEHTTLKTLTGSNFNPLVRITSEGFLVLSPELGDKSPDKINVINVTNPDNLNRIQIVFEVRNFRNNILKNIRIRVRLAQKFFDQDGNPIPVEVSEYNEYYTKFKVVELKDYERIIIENNVVMGHLDPFQEEVILKTEGIISNSIDREYGYDVWIDINSDGIGVIYFMMPQIKAPEVSVSMEFLNTESTILKTISLKNNNSIEGDTVIFDGQENFTYQVVSISRVGETGTAVLRGIRSLIDLEIYTVRTFAEYGTAGLPLRRTKILSYDIQGDTIWITFTSQQRDGDFIIVRSQNLERNYITLDSSSIYGI